MKNCIVNVALTAFLLLFLLTSCEKSILDETEASVVSAPDVNVTLTFSPYTISSFTRSVAPLSDQCSRLSVALFSADGTKVKSINQKQSDATFGSVSLSLSPATYTLVAVAHNSTEGNATISSPEKVTFASNKMTDTFSYCGTLTVTENPLSETIQLQRVVAMVRLTLTDTNIPATVERLKFYYTGGSSTLNPTIGLGCVNSKQTEYRYVRDSDGSPVATYDLYTSPHEQSDVLKLTVTALASDGSSVGEWTMDDIPVTLNKITTWSGPLFSGSNEGTGTNGQSSLAVILDPAWSGTVPYSY